VRSAGAEETLTPPALLPLQQFDQQIHKENDENQKIHRLSSEKTDHITRLQAALPQHYTSWLCVLRISRHREQ
jgi:hypothetical protein